MKLKKVAAVFMAAGVGAVTLVGCSDGGSTTATTTAEEAKEDKIEPTTVEAAAPGVGQEAGFEEFPVGDDLELSWADGKIKVAGVYFQPVDLEPATSGLSAADSDFHIEADISALENEVGYEQGTFIPQLTVDYEIIADDGKGAVAASGTFMDMNASDGPHYGANVALKDAGKYLVRFTIKSPAEKGWVLHTDEETGVKGKFWTEPLVAEWHWDYVPQDWNN